MKERPILYSASMVRAILRPKNPKWQTRRVVRGVDECPHGYDEVRKFEDGELHLAGGGRVACPHGKAGERLWVRESWRALRRFESSKPRDIPAGSMVAYEADQHPAGSDYLPVPTGRMGKLRPGIFLPRWACRLELEVTAVRAERLQEISGDDCLAEGIELIGMEGTETACRARYFALWDSLNEKRGYGSGRNPWVWVIEFKRAT